MFQKRKSLEKKSWRACSGSSKIPVSPLSPPFCPHLVSSFFSAFLLCMLSSFNPETVRSLPCCYRYTALLRIQLLLSQISLTLLSKIKRKKKTCVSASSYILRGVLIFLKVSQKTLFTCLAVALTCYLAFSLCLSQSFESLSTAVFLRSQVVHKGGIQFQERSLIGRFERFGWFFYFLSLSWSFFSSLSFLSCNPPSLQQTVQQ